MTEQWASIREDPRYQISDQGRVKTPSGYIKKNGPRPNGRFYLNLFVGDKRKAFGVHRLVLEAFVGPCPPGLEACHGDGDPGNNNVGNLRWGTHSDNIKDSTQHGTHAQKAKTKCSRGHDLVCFNLSPKQWKDKGHRKCLACARTNSYVGERRRRLGESFTSSDIQRLSDDRFNRQMLEHIATSDCTHAYNECLYSEHVDLQEKKDTKDYK